MDCKTCKHYKWFPREDKYCDIGMHLCVKCDAWHKKERIAVCNGKYYEAKEEKEETK